MDGEFYHGGINGAVQEIARLRLALGLFVAGTPRERPSSESGAAIAAGPGASALPCSRARLPARRCDEGDPSGKDYRQPRRGSLTRLGAPPPFNSCWTP